MYDLPDRTKSDSCDETSNENSSAGKLTAKDIGQNFIKRANSIKLALLFTRYGVSLDFNNKAPCPIPSHKDKSASFYYYIETNSFHCFGCKAGSRPVDFVSLMEGINKNEAVKKILSEFDVNSDIHDDGEDYHQIMLNTIEFSTMIREFILLHKKDSKAIDFAEKTCKTFDSLFERQKLHSNAKALQSAISYFKKYIGQYNHVSNNHSR